MNKTNIKPGELRIGNKFIWQDKIITILDMHKNCVNSEWDNFGKKGIEVDQLEPILLWVTEIEDYEMPFMGIKNANKTLHGIYEYYDSGNYVEINFRTEERTDIKIVTSHGTHKLKRSGIKYLHQFQNLYIDLTGKEIFFEGKWEKTIFDL